MTKAIQKSVRLFPNLPAICEHPTTERLFVWTSPVSDIYTAILFDNGARFFSEYALPDLQLTLRTLPPDVDND